MQNDTLLICAPLPAAATASGVAGVVEACSILGAFLLAAVALLVWFRMAVQLRPR